MLTLDNKHTGLFADVCNAARSPCSLMEIPLRRPECSEGSLRAAGAGPRVRPAAFGQMVSENGQY